MLGLMMQCRADGEKEARDCCNRFGGRDLLFIRGFDADHAEDEQHRN